MSFPPTVEAITIPHVRETILLNGNPTLIIRVSRLVVLK